MEERMSQLETTVGLLTEQVKLLLDQNSSKPLTVLKFKPKIRHSKRKGRRSVMIYQAPAPVDSLPPEMLQMVMKKLDSKSLKNSRLVCRKWNVHVTPVLANQTTMNVRQFFPWDEGDQEYKLIFPPKGEITTSLIRNIYADDEDEVDIERELLTAFCEKYTNEVKGLKFNGWFINDNERLLVLYRMLTELCPNLQDLCVNEIYYDKEQGKLTQEKMSFEFSKPLALKVLRLRRDLADDDESTNVLPLSNFLDNVIHASKQLETLEVDLEYCPKDLSNLTKLKNLDLRQMSFSEIKSIKLSYQNYIENLSISATQENSSQSKDKTTEKYQQFPALRNLKIQSLYDGKPEASNFAYYMLERSPVLKSLTIDGDGTMENSLKTKMLRDLFHTKPAGIAFSRLSTLKFLDINFKDQELFQSIVNLTDFPNLTTLEFSIGMYASLQFYERDRKVSGWFGILSKLKLVHLNLNIHCEIKMSNIASGISRNPSLFRGLETLKITYDRHVGADDLYGSPKKMAAFQKALKMTSTLKQVQFVGFLMRGRTLKDLMDFVAKNCLPVEID